MRSFMFRILPAESTNELLSLVDCVGHVIKQLHGTLGNAGLRRNACS